MRTKWFKHISRFKLFARILFMCLLVVRQIPGYTGSMSAPSCELWRSLAKFGEVWRTHNTIFMRTSLAFTRVPAKVPHLHQSSGEGAFCIGVAVRMCPLLIGFIPAPTLHPGCPGDSPPNRPGDSRDLTSSHRPPLLLCQAPRAAAFKRSRFRVDVGRF